jgi:two-component system response regulator HydG
LNNSVLVVDDDPDQCALLALGLSRVGFSVTTSGSPSECLELARAGDFATIVTDLSMAEMSGLELCEQLLATFPDTPVIVVTAYGSMETAIGAIRVGAFDFLAKPLDMNLVGLSVARAVKHHDLVIELRRLRDVVVDESAFKSIIGLSPSMARVHDLVARVARTDASVVIEGETGTGKELVARSIHDASPRKNGPFVAINCAAVPPNLIESELFGHARGAFTDAKTSRIGLFAQASGGTLFLDEIGEMPLEMQPKLLRALQERVVRPVGGTSDVKFDVRLVSASNRDLEAEVEEQRFRQDLFYRINVVKVEVPPLRERGSDVLTLARYFIGRFAARAKRPPMELTTPVAERLLAYDWPGNVRELENCLEHAVALGRFERITVDDLPEKVRAYSAQPFAVAVNEPDEVLPLDQLERNYIFRVLKLVDGNKARAAKMLGLDRRTLYRKLDLFRDLDAGKPVPGQATGE